ncbi:MAG: hypothetical protein LBI03_10625 [Clostridiales bacterium]|jgi:uncharacterized protein YkwD|nr:hypothetical protein [Clostridiales bacterium]
MKRILIVFISMLTLFIGIWTIKAQTPVGAIDNNMTNYATGVWQGYDGKSEVSPEWILDPEIPENYLPVPGRKELYMVIDNDGHIMCYRQRTKQSDGSWLWTDVNPDIPEQYEAVSGLKDIYKVTDTNGNVSYYKYIRNDDDTFAFVPVDQNGNTLSAVPKGDEIPANYRWITGNIYAVLNEYGVVIGYKERRSNADGTFSWVDCEKPVIKKDTGNPVIPGISPSIPGGNNTSDTPSENNSQNPINQTNPYPSEETNPQNPGSTNPPSNPGGSLPTPGIITAPQSDGTYTETETLITSDTSGGWIMTYQTIVVRVYSERGVLMSTKKDGPTLISKVKAGDNDPNAPDPSKIANTLGEELVRVSVGLTYKTDMANDVLSLLNADRVADGLPALRMDTNSNAYKIAQILAADMAIYDHSDYDSPLYGTLQDMLVRFNIKSGAPSENTWKTSTSKNAGAIHARFTTLDGTRQARMSQNYTNIGIAIVQKNGYYYVCEILLD